MSTEEKLILLTPYLYGILLSLIVVNLVIFGIFYIKGPNKINRSFSLFWLAQALAFVAGGIFTEGDIAKTIPFSISIFCAHLIYQSFFQSLDKVPSFAPFYAIFGVGFAAAVINDSLFHNFFLTTFPVALCLALPSFYGLYLIASKDRPEFKTIFHKILFVFISLSAVHTFNFPIFADRPANDLWGMGAHIVIMTGLSLTMMMFHTYLQEVAGKEKLQLLVKQKTAQLNKRCLQLQDMSEEKAALFRVVLHDISNPMCAILGYVEYAKSDLASPEKKKEYLEGAKRSALAVADTISQVRLMDAVSAKKEDFYQGALDLHEVFASVETIFRPQFEAKGVELNVKYPKEDLRLYGNKELLTQSVLGNLLSNALKFSRPGSGVVLSSEKIDDKLKIFVSDNGTGIERGKIDHLFDIRHSTSSLGTQGERGTGFGMPLLKRYMDQVGGSVKIHSRHEKENKEEHGTNVELVFSSKRPQTSTLPVN